MPFFINIPLPAFLEVSEAVLESTLWYASELFGHGRLNGLNVNIYMAFQCSFQS
jgi:hypothetical protein